MDDRLLVMEETLAAVREAGATAYVEDTKAAVARYNRLAATEPVAGLFHSTC